MKKCRLTTSLLVGIFSLILLASCQTKSDSTGANYLSDPKFDTEEALPQYDHDKSWTHRLGDSSSCITEDTFYFSNRSTDNYYIYYCDLATGINGPLCGKPECAHSNSDCNAYTREKAFGLSIYNGQLYWTARDDESHPAIYCMNLDGTNRVKVQSLSDSLYDTISGNRILIFHRGYTIYGGQVASVSGSSVRYGLFVYAISLSTGEETVILDELFDEGVIPSLDLVPYCNQLYLITSYGLVDGDVSETLNISSWNLKTHETFSLYSHTHDFLFREAWATEEGLLLSTVLTGDVYKFDFGDNTLDWFFDFNKGNGGDGCMEFANDYLIKWTLTDSHIPHIRITDLTGKELYSADLDLPTWPSQGYGYLLMGADHTNLYIQLRLRDTTTQPSTNLIKIAQIPLDGTGSIRELWLFEEDAS